MKNLISTLMWICILILYISFLTPKDLVAILDVGQGDAILIQEGDIQVLVDGGPDSSILYELAKFMPVYDRRIEYIVITHTHDDHIVGILDVVNRYEVGEILYYPVCFENANYEFLIQSFPDMRKVGRGETIRLKTFNINILWPILNKEGRECVKSFNGNVNDDSLVLDFEFLNKKFLLMGDIESPVESTLLKEGLISKEYDILKAGHHCSKTSSSETFIKYVSPSLAVCSVGVENSFGHPSGETLGTYLRLGVQYLLTSQKGSIQIK
ncbi:MBL fold metallo-hydrolase [Candidatus Dojkabacteria bacterium]|uniref:MBL fold metallo-hydrolase n=1 Tax=Candidatus Dojkabacteria bacterium TaxID=2099670 RepID=A0A847ETP4_9BACT|nr:MBL fold metallo-hydrolase [Candidatus Dojkabacteria bacterium]